MQAQLKIGLCCLKKLTLQNILTYLTFYTITICTLESLKIATNILQNFEDFFFPNGKKRAKIYERAKKRD